MKLHRTLPTKNQSIGRLKIHRKKAESYLGGKDHRTAVEVIRAIDEQLKIAEGRD